MMAMMKTEYHDGRHELKVKIADIDKLNINDMVFGMKVVESSNVAEGEMLLDKVSGSLYVKTGTDMSKIVTMANGTLPNVFVSDKERSAIQSFDHGIPQLDSYGKLLIDQMPGLSASRSDHVHMNGSTDYLPQTITTADSTPPGFTGHIDEFRISKGITAMGGIGSISGGSGGSSAAGISSGGFLQGIQPLYDGSINANKLVGSYANNEVSIPFKASLLVKR